MVREASEKKIFFLPHAVRQMSRPDRMIRVACPILGGDDRRPIQVVCSPKAESLAIITAYEPDPAQWEADFKTRRSE